MIDFDSDEALDCLRAGMAEPVDGENANWRGRCPNGVRQRIETVNLAEHGLWWEQTDVPSTQILNALR